MTAAWSVNRRAAAAVAHYATSQADRYELCEMLGIYDDAGRLLPDDNAVYAFTDPGAGPGAKSPNPIAPLAAAECRRPAGMTTPAGLATLGDVGGAA